MSKANVYDDYSDILGDWHEQSIEEAGFHSSREHRLKQMISENLEKGMDFSDAQHYANMKLDVELLDIQKND